MYYLPRFGGGVYLLFKSKPVSIDEALKNLQML